MNRHWSVLLSVLPCLLLTACSQPPAPATTTPSAVQARKGGDSTPRVSLFCGPKSHVLDFAALGVPESETPIAVALNDEYAYVLFASRLLRLPVSGDRMEPEMTINRGKEAWVGLDLDPVDGSAWIATDQFVLHRISPGWEDQTVAIQKVVGDGGLHSVRVTQDAIYAVPVCAADAVWRIDRSGKILGSAFPVPERPADEPVSAAGLRCSTVRLERNAEGKVFAWDFARRKVFDVDAQGDWTEADPGLLAAVTVHPTTVRGANLGAANEHWYVSGILNGLFYWKGRPVVVGNFGPDRSRVLVVPGPGGTRDVLHDCDGAALIAAATLGDRYAAISNRSVMLGSMADAPALPE